MAKNTAGSYEPALIARVRSEAPVAGRGSQARPGLLATERLGV